MKSNRELVKWLVDQGVLKSSLIKKAILAIDRKDFVLENYKNSAYLDEALPILEGQTISQPLTVVFMLELLSPKKGDKVMDIGAGSCWQSAILAHIVGKSGFIYALELLPELCDFGGNNLEKYPQIEKRVNLICRNAVDGLPNITNKIGGFDCIISAAELKNEPETWRKQLKVGGKLVYPRAGGIFKETKMSENMFDEQFFPGFVFVPFIEKK